MNSYNSNTYTLIEERKSMVGNTKNDQIVQKCFMR